MKPLASLSLVALITATAALPAQAENFSSSGVFDEEPLPAKPAPTDDDATGSHVHRYGLELLGVDMATVIVGGGISYLLRDKDGAPFCGGALFFGGYALAPALIHLGHDNHKRAFASAALRVGLPIAGAYAMSYVDGSRAWGSAFLGGGLGLISAAVIDYTLLAKQETFESSSLVGASAISLAPSIHASADGELEFGFAGRF